MLLTFKKYRVEAGLTRAKLAKAAGVSEERYCKWENGGEVPPPSYLKKVAKKLGVRPDVLLGTHPPIEARLYDFGVPEEQRYYGEVSIHFRGGGEPLVASISEAEYAKLIVLH